MNAEINIEFERPCHSCEGSSKWTGVDCGVCKNTGRVTTTLGDELLEFLEHQGFTPTKEAARDE